MKIVVISMQSLTSVNRGSFFELSKLYDVKLLVPNKLKLLGKSFKSIDSIEDDGYKLELFKFQIFNPLIYFSFDLLLKVLKNINSSKAIVCDFEPSTLIGFLIRIICLVFNTKVIFIGVDHNNFDLNYKNILFKPKFFLKKLIKRFFLIGSKNKNCLITACNHYAINNYKNIGINCTFMPLGYSSKIFFSNNNNKRSHNIRIGMLGRIVKEKGAHILIEAIQRSTLKNFKLVIDNFSEYGDSYKESISDLIKKNDLSNKIEFVSPSHKEMGLLINSLDIIVMPSISTDSWIEQYGRIAVESLACGKPVIASNCGSLPFILNKYGRIFNEGSVRQLTELLNGTVEIIDNFNSKEAELYAYNNYSDFKQSQMINNLIKT